MTDNGATVSLPAVFPLSDFLKGLEEEMLLVTAKLKRASQVKTTATAGLINPLSCIPATPSKNSIETPTRSAIEIFSSLLVYL